jgi:hypothetical protein
MRQAGGGGEVQQGSVGSSSHKAGAGGRGSAEAEDTRKGAYAQEVRTVIRVASSDPDLRPSSAGNPS